MAAGWHGFGRSHVHLPSLGLRAGYSFWWGCNGSLRLLGSGVLFTDRLGFLGAGRLGFLLSSVFFSLQRTPLARARSSWIAISFVCFQLPKLHNPLLQKGVALLEEDDGCLVPVSRDNASERDLELPTSSAGLADTQVRCPDHKVLAPLTSWEWITRTHSHQPSLYEPDATVKSDWFCA